MGTSTGRAKEIFLAASELGVAEREDFVRDACSGDAELARRVDELLAAREAVGDLLSCEATHEVGPSILDLFDDGLGAGRTIGPYELIELVGEGGFGSVWSAKQRAPFERRVAVKVLKAGLEVREVVARFEAERQALARMDHPSIARIYDAGASENGRPFFAMELVDGVPITRYCRDAGLSTEARIDLFLQVCRAVQHAHQKGVVHRDIKPSNVLVTEVDGEPLVKVIDFGIAKAVQGRLVADTKLTLQGQIVGTPTYMSPEQIGGGPDIDTRTDVYSLGVLLYELLSGTTPFGDTTRRTLGLEEILRIIREVEPPRPSTKLSQRTAYERTEALEGRGVGPTERVRYRHVRGDLDWIVMCCLEKDRERRYGSVGLLIADLERHQSGEPILAGPPDLLYRLSKFVRRHVRWLAVVLALILSLAAGAIVSQSQAQRARRAERVMAVEARHAREAEARMRAEAERAQRAESRLAQEAQRARTELERAREVASFLEHVLLSVDPNYARGKDLTLLRHVLERAATGIAGREGQLPEVEATLRRAIGGAYFQLALYREAQPHLVRALELRHEALGLDDDATIQSALELGALYLRTGRYDDADEPVTRAYEGRKSAYGASDPRTLEALGNLAVLRRKQGQLEQSLAYHEELEAAHIERVGERHEDSLRAMSNLAGLLQELGRHDEALERYEWALDLGVELRGEGHPTSAAAMHNLGTFYLDNGALEEAELLLERALEIKRGLLAGGHPSLLMTQNNLAGLYGRTGRGDQARVVYEEALAGARAALGERDSTTLGLRFNLAQLEARGGEEQRALERVEGLLPLCREVLGEGAELTVSATRLLGRLRAAVGAEH